MMLRATTTFGFDRVRIAFLAMILAGLAAPHLAAAESPAPAGVNVILNGDLAKGSGNSPDHWRTEAWEQKPEVTTYKWTAPSAAGPGELEVNSVKPNDARWLQSIGLEPGWYYLSADVRTEEVGQTTMGASISVMEDGIVSPDIRATSDWRRVGLYLRIGSRGADVEIACRLGGFSSLNSGRAFFRNIAALKIAAPPAGAAPVYDLEAIRKQSATAPIGSPWTLVAAFIFLGAVAYFGWRVFAEELPEAVQSAERQRPRKASQR